MNDSQNLELIRGDAIRTEGDVNKLDFLFTLPEWSIGVQERVSSLTNHLRQIVDFYNGNGDYDLQIVVGGKSRQLTEVMLNSVRERLPQNHFARELIDHHVRLNDVENKNLYSETTSAQDESAQEYIIPSKIKPRATVLFIDDFINSGRKAFHSVKAIAENGGTAFFIAFGGNTRNIMEEDTSRRPADWNRFIEQIFIAEGNSVSGEVLELTSNLFSRYIDVKSNHKISMAKVATSVSFDELNPDHAYNLQKSRNYLRVIRDMLNASDQYFRSQSEKLSQMNIKIDLPEK